jgi:hypothetical protein
MKHVEADGLLSHLKASSAQAGWRDMLDPFDSLGAPDVSLHLAVLVEPYLSFILDGQKTVESRFSIRSIPPYGRVSAGDVVLLKISGGPIVGAFTAAAVWSYELDPASWSELRRDFTDALCAQAGFWEQRSRAVFATLVRVADVRRLSPLSVPKRDRRAWVVLAARREAERLL